MPVGVQPHAAWLVQQHQRANLIEVFPTYHESVSLDNNNSMKLFLSAWIGKFIVYEQLFRETIGFVRERVTELVKLRIRFDDVRGVVQTEEEQL